MKTGKVARVYKGDLDSDGIVDNFDFNGIAGAAFTEVRVSLSSNLAYLTNATQQLKFNFEDAGMVANSNKLFRLWTKDASQSRTSANLLRSGIQYNASDLGLLPGQSITLYLESVNPTRTTVNFDPLSVTTTIASSIWSGSVSDNVHLIGLDLSNTNDARRFLVPEAGDCSGPVNRDGDLAAINDLDTFLGLNLKAGGVREINVLNNDKYADIGGFQFSLNLQSNTWGVPVQVLHAPANYQLYWFQFAAGTGSYAKGTFSIDLHFVDATYHGDGAHAHVGYAGTMTVQPTGGVAKTLNVGYSTCAWVDYASPLFGLAAGSITGSALSDSGVHSVLMKWNQCQSGVSRLWNRDQSDPNRIQMSPGTEYSLTELGYNSTTGLSAFYIELFVVHHSHWDKKGIEDFGKPNDRIEATLVFQGQDQYSDEVKYMFIEQNSFYDNLQHREELRNAMAAPAVYDFTGGADIPQFAMRAIGSAEMINDLELGPDIVAKLGSNSPVPRFRCDRPTFGRLHRRFFFNSIARAIGTGDVLHGLGTYRHLLPLWTIGS